jgi:hypothetical protein
MSTENSNTGLTLEQFIEDLKRLGRDDGKGKGARVAAYVRAVDAAQKLNISKKKDGKDLYMHYAKEAAKNSGKEFSAGASLDVQVSKFGTAIDLGNLPDVDGYRFVHRVIDKLREHQSREDSGVKGSTYDNIVACSRAQVAQPTRELTDDEIDDVIVTVAKEKTELDLVIDLYKRANTSLGKMPKTSPALPYMEQTIIDLADAIKALDGELPPITKEEKARARVMAQAAKHGIQVMPNTTTLIRNGEVL